MFGRSALVGILLIAACGSVEGSTRYPIDEPSIGLSARPESIVSLSPTATEMLFALGAGDQVVAVDDQSDFPAEAPMTSLSGFTPNLEAIASYEPDLVLISYDPGDLVEGLGALGIPVLVLEAPIDIDGVYAQIELLGRVVDRDGRTLVDAMKAEVAEIVADAEAGGLSYYHELDPSYYTATSSTFIGSLYSLLGMENVADPADQDGFGYPQLSAEYIIAADPDVVVLADTRCCAVDARSLMDRPGWSQMTAVREGRVIEIDDSVASRWGPRIVDFLRSVAEGVAAG